MRVIEILNLCWFYLSDEFSWLNFSEKKKQKPFTQIDGDSCWNKQKAENLEISRESLQTERNERNVEREKKRSCDFEVTHDEAKRTKYKRALEKDCEENF